MTAFLAMLFSLVAPGAGHILIGCYGEGFFLGVLFALGKSTLLPLGLRIFNVSDLKRTLQILYACNWGYIVLILYAAVSSFWRGFYAEQIHFLYAVLFAIIVTLVYKNTLNNFIFTALCGRTEIYELLRAKQKSQTVKK